MVIAEEDLSPQVSLEWIVLIGVSLFLGVGCGLERDVEFISVNPPDGSTIRPNTTITVILSGVPEFMTLNVWSGSGTTVTQGVDCVRDMDTRLTAVFTDEDYVASLLTDNLELTDNTDSTQPSNDAGCDDTGGGASDKILILAPSTSGALDLHLEWDDGNLRLDYVVEAPEFTVTPLPEQGVNVNPE